MLKKILFDIINTNYKELAYDSAAFLVSSVAQLVSELVVPVLVSHLFEGFLFEEDGHENISMKMAMVLYISNQINTNVNKWANLRAQELSEKISHFIYLDGLDRLNRSQASSRNGENDVEVTSLLVNTCVAIDFTLTNLSSFIVPFYISQHTLWDSNPDNNSMAYVNLAIIFSKLLLAAQTSSQLDFYQDQAQRTQAHSLAHRNDMLRGHRLILSENAFKSEARYCAEQFYARYKASTQKNRYVFMVYLGIEAFSVIPVLYLLYWLCHTEKMDEKPFLLLLSGLNSTNLAAKHLGFSYVNFNMLRHNLKKLSSLYTRKLETDVVNTNVLDDIHSIEFVSVYYQNPDGAYILENVSFKMQRGELIALHGQSGSGKSSIFQLIQKFVYPASGDILINGRSLSMYTPIQIREKLTSIASDTYIFNRSLWDICQYGLPEEVSEDDILRAIQWIGLSEKIATLPEGMNTIIQNNGNGQLSGGEKQKLHLVRAFLKNKNNLLLLDEATSAIDEKTLMEVIHPRLSDSFFKKNRIIVMISHDSRHHQWADRVLTVSHQRVTENFTLFNARSQPNVIIEVDEAKPALK